MLHASSTLFVTVIGVAVLSICAVDAGSAVNLKELEFMPEQQQRAAFSNFVFKFDTPVVQTPNGDVRAQVLATSPLLATLPVGVAQALVTLKPCALLQAHVHPRGTELAFVTKGELFMGFLEEDGGRFISAVVKQNENIVFPQGLVHFILNTGCKEEAQFLATFPTSDPGTVTIAPALFRLPNNVLRATFGLFDADVKKVGKAALAVGSVNPSVDPMCAAKCGMTY